MYPQNNYYYPSTPTAAYQQPQTNAVPPVMQYAPIPQGLKGRPVSSFEEARAMTIDFDGSTFFFPDLANKRIYTKQINMDGTASLFVYELREKPVETAVPTGDFITREEFEKVIQELRAAAPAATAKMEAQKPAFNLF